MLHKIIFAIALLLSFSAFSLEGWYENFEVAKERAIQDDKHLLLNFSGSDWCSYCIKLDKEVFEKKDFSESVSDDFLFVMIDFPRRKPQLDWVKKQNKQLKNQFGVNAFPTIFLYSPQNEDRYWRGGYSSKGPQNYAQVLLANKALYENETGSLATNVVKIFERAIDVNPASYIADLIRKEIERLK